MTRRPEAHLVLSDGTSFEGEAAGSLLDGGIVTGDQFFDYLKDTFDVLYAEGEIRPKMMSVGLHARLAGRPGRMAGLERCLRYAVEHDDVWFCRRLDIARHWRKRHPAPGLRR